MTAQTLKYKIQVNDSVNFNEPVTTTTSQKEVMEFTIAPNGVQNNFNGIFTQFNPKVITVEDITSPVGAGFNVQFGATGSQLAIRGGSAFSMGYAGTGFPVMSITNLSNSVPLVIRITIEG